MYAIIQTAGHQLKVTPGGFATVAGTVAEPGEKVTLEQVLLVEKDGGAVVAGAPYIKGATVTGVVEAETKGPKIRVFKMKRRKHYRKTRGHRTIQTRVRVTTINA